MVQKKISGYLINLDQLLGEGAYGRVQFCIICIGVQGNRIENWSIVCSQDNHESQQYDNYVIIIVDSDTYLKQALFRQIEILKMIKSQNVVGFLDVMESNHNYYLIQEMCDGDLQHILKKQTIISQELAVKYLKEISNGMLALVREGIIHRQIIFVTLRDLKPANIMTSKGVAKIGDFGFAKQNSHKRLKNKTSVGTPLYMSIEILKSQPYTSKCDIWALGFILYEMLHGMTPWTAKTEFELVKNLENKALKMKQNLNPKTKDFLSKCLAIKQCDRISWDQLFMHPIFQGNFNNYAEQNKIFENKLKVLMSDLRFMINSQNIDLKRLFDSLGFTKNKPLSLQDFRRFIRSINPNLTSQQQKFFFEKMDKDDDASISIHELQAEMQKNHINLTSRVKAELLNIFDISTTNIFSKDEQFSEEGSKISNQLQSKVQKCFIKLYKILTIKKITLYKLFVSCDRERTGYLSVLDFAKIIKKLDPSFTDIEVEAVFKFIDEDDSKNIQFEELNAYYCKVNGIPQGSDLPAEYHHKKLYGL